MQDRIIGSDEAARLVNLHPHTLPALVRRGQFPAPVDLGTRRAAWRLSDIEAWIASRPTKRHEIAQSTLNGRDAYWARVKAGKALHPRTIAKIARGKALGTIAAK